MRTDFKNLKVALVHDWLVSCGGGERVLYDFHSIFPDAPIYTLVYDPEKAPKWTTDCDIRTTYIQKWPGGKNHHKLLLAFMPKAWESLDLMQYDLVISSCASCCKGVLTRPDAIHICYCHTPIRYVWDRYFEYYAGAGAFKRFFMRRMIHSVRMWDYLAAQRVDNFIANSNFVGKRIQKFYRRDADTIYPGVVVTNDPVSEKRDDFYLVVSRFVSYKRVDLAIEACNQLGRRLVVVGSGGEEEERLRGMAGPSIEFVGRISDDEMRSYYHRAKAFLFPGIEDFGLTPLEAQEGGAPVIAYGEGGALETVVDGKTGLFFHEQTTEALITCLKHFEREGVAFTHQQIHDASLKFSEDAFKNSMCRYIDDKVSAIG
jgi:glycosyltransferase involved in cell wall biosynthesis